MAERDAISGRLKDARKELTDAIYLDPSNRVVRDRLTEISALAPDDPQTSAQRNGIGRSGETAVYEPGRRISISGATRREPTTK